MRLSFLAIFAAVAVLSGCGGGGGGSASGSSSSSSGGTGVDQNDRVVLTASGSATPVPSYHNTDLEFTVANPTNTAATNVVLTITLGAGLSRAGLNCFASGGATCPSDSSAMTVASLPAGGSLRYQMSVIVAGGTTGSVSSSAQVSATNDPVTTNNTAQLTITAYSADVNLAGSTTATDFAAGSVIPYSITVSNTGPDAARDLLLETSLSSGQVMTTVGCTASGGAICPAGTGATMTVTTLPSGGSLTFAISSQLSMSVTVSASATMRATVVGDANFANNTTTISALTRIPTSANSPSFIYLHSDAGDYVGSYYAGADYTYDLGNAVFDVYSSGGQLTVRVHGDEQWNAIFQMPANQVQIQPGTYSNRLGTSFGDPVTGGMTWSGEGRGCSASGWFKVDDVVYAQGILASIDIRFEQHCDGATPALRAQIHWVANDSTRPPGPVNPPPAGLWTPAAGATPASGNYLYIESDPMDFVGQGDIATFTQANSVLRVVSEADGELGVGARGDADYGGNFRPMVPLAKMAPGYYARVSRVAAGNPARGRMSMGGNSRGCNTITGWFVIDSIAFSGDTIIALDMRFEQHCEGNTPALRGRVHWRSDDPATPAGPVVPPPAGLWAPASGVIPASGNAIYIEGDINDYVSSGITELYTPLNSIFDIGGGGIDPAGNRFQLTVRGDHEWTGFFQTMNTLPDLRVGYYGDAQRMGFGNPTKAGLDWYGEGRGCNRLHGWFVIDNLTYSGSSLTAIELRFEQYCDTSTRPLHGYIRWSASDTRVPLPPVNPPPATLWDAPVGSTPTTGENYVYQESEPGSWVGAGKTYLYTAHNAVFPMTVSDRQLNVEVWGDERWGGYFAPMLPLTQLQVGYYGNLTGSNTAKGTAYWSGDGRACGGTYGWFVVDGVSYNPAGALTALDARLEHRCYPTEPAVRVKIHWRLDDPTVVPGPQNPPPASLWTPPGTVPATGNYFYVVSDPGDFIGQGETHLFTPSNSTISGGTRLDGTVVGAQDGTEFFVAHFDRMISIPRLQVGYYPNVQDTLLHNPTVGGLNVSGNSNGCSEISGWFMIDSVAHQGDEVTAIEARFEQHCGGNAAAIRGSLRWQKP